ncbi:hypothetical protein JH269_12730 [Xanthomonas campestris pv. campestris]|uniref:hypothetical protein n=1 Tax=Xanthomonas campestris TaxID=339 RepID=UPI002379AE6B|nr:hypothetical protein [Xanthomonas campestris]WDL65482.1 hypothetical protein JH269_12730 [Xanthomonas campestris pv. campestris]
MNTFHVNGIIWETDGKRPVLPTETTVECESEEDIADVLSDRYGWLVTEIAAVETLAP